MGRLSKRQLGARKAWKTRRAITGSTLLMNHTNGHSDKVTASVNGISSKTTISAAELIDMVDNLSEKLNEFIKAGRSTWV